MVSTAVMDSSSAPDEQGSPDEPLTLGQETEPALLLTKCSPFYSQTIESTCAGITDSNLGHSTPSDKPSVEHLDAPKLDLEGQDSQGLLGCLRGSNSFESRLASLAVSTAAGTPTLEAADEDAVETAEPTRHFWIGNLSTHISRADLKNVFDK